MLTEEKIKKNVQKFNETGVKYGVINDELRTLLGVDFITAPCTTTNNNLREGGSRTLPSGGATSRAPRAGGTRAG